MMSILSGCALSLMAFLRGSAKEMVPFQFGSARDSNWKLRPKTKIRTWIGLLFILLPLLFLPQFTNSHTHTHTHNWENRKLLSAQIPTGQLIISIQLPASGPTQRQENIGRTRYVAPAQLLRERLIQPGWMPLAITAPLPPPPPPPLVAAAPSIARFVCMPLIHTIRDPHE